MTFERRALVASFALVVGACATSTPSTTGLPAPPVSSAEEALPIARKKPEARRPRQRALSTEAARAALQAELLLQAGDVPGALDAWRQAARADDTSPYLHVRLGEAFLLVGEAVLAKDAASRALALCQDGKDDDDEADQRLAALRLVAQAKAELGDGDGGEAALREVLALAPGDSAASALLAQHLVARGALDEAEEVVVSWLRASAGVAGAVTLAMVFAERGQLDRALIHLGRALEKDPDSAEALQAKLTILWAAGRYGDAVDVAGEAVRATGETEETRSTFLTAVALASPGATAPLVSALLSDDASERERLLVADALERGGLLDEAIAALRARKSSSRASPLLLLELARLHLQNHEPDPAAALACRVADALSPADLRLLDQATALCARAELARGDGAGPAIARLVHVATAGPPRPRPLHALASAVEFAGQAGPSQSAVAVALQAARERLSGDDVDVVIAAASVLSAGGKGDEALVALERMLRERPTDARIVLAHARALEQRATNDAEVLAAVELVARLRERQASASPDGVVDDIDALNFMAFALAERGLKPDDARDLAWRAVLRDPTNGYVMDTLGWAELKAGDACGAVRTLRRADRLAPHEAELWFHVGVAEQACGNVDAARAAAARAKALVAHHDPLRPRIEALAASLEK